VVTHEGRRDTAKFQTKREALEWESGKRSELKASKRQQGDMDLMTFCTKYLDYSKRFDRKTYLEKRSVCRRFMETRASETSVGRVTEEMVLAFLDRRAEEKSANASNKDRKNLLAMWHWGEEILRMTYNPVFRIKRRAHHRETQYVPPAEDVLRVLAAATREERVFLKCYIHTGARKSEIFRWLWHEDINLERRQYRLGTRKTRDGSMEYEWFPMPDDLYAELTWWWKNRPVRETPYVFVSSSGRHYGKPFTARQGFMHGICKRAGVRPFGFHALRRFFASLLADSDKVSTKTIQRLLRHKSFHTTERYIKHLNTDLKASLDVIGESLSKIHPSHTPKEEGVSEDND
jgi:integrase